MCGSCCARVPKTLTRRSGSKHLWKICQLYQWLGRNTKNYLPTNKKKGSKSLTFFKIICAGRAKVRGVTLHEFCRLRLTDSAKEDQRVSKALPGIRALHVIVITPTATCMCTVAAIIFACVPLTFSTAVLVTSALRIMSKALTVRHRYPRVRRAGLVAAAARATLICRTLIVVGVHFGTALDHPNRCG